MWARKINQFILSLDFTYIVMEAKCTDELNVVLKYIARALHFKLFFRIDLYRNAFNILSIK